MTRFEFMMSSQEAAIGQQVQMLRKAAGMEVSYLAKRVELASKEIVDLEEGRRCITTKELSDIAVCLGVSQLAILEPDSLLARLPIATRQHDSLGEDEDKRDDTVERITAMAELDWALNDGKPCSNTKIVHAPKQENSSSWLDHAQALADWTIKQFGNKMKNYNTLPDLAVAIETCLEIDVMIEDFNRKTPLGISITDLRFPFILINAKQPTPRGLFTLAHELGHVLNRDGEIAIDYDLEPSTGTEKAANAFAAMLLMPASRIKEINSQYDKTPESLAHMLINFGVSYEALIYRLHNLKIINKNGRDQLKRIGWTGLIASLEDNTLAGSLLSVRGSSSERRPPTLLTKRCLHGMMNGTMGAGPVARLLDMDVDHLIEKNKNIPEATKVINDDYSSPQDPPQIAQSAFDVDPIAVQEKHIGRAGRMALLPFGQDFSAWAFRTEGMSAGHHRLGRPRSDSEMVHMERVRRNTSPAGRACGAPAPTTGC